MVLRAGFSRIFALVFTLIGAPLLMLLVISGAHTIREGVAWVWTYRARKRQIQDTRPDQYENTRATSAISSLNIISGRPSTPPSTPETITTTNENSGTWNQVTQPQPKVQSIDDALGGSRPSSGGSSANSRDEITTLPSTSDNPTRKQNGNSIRHITRNDRNSNHQQNNNISNETNSDTVHHRIQRVRPMPLQPDIRRIKPPPFIIFVVLLLIHLLLGLAIFIPIQRWSVPSAIYILGCNLLTLDHGGLGERRLINSPWVVVLYVIYLVFGCIIVASVILTTWPRISNLVSNTGKYLEVVRPVRLPR